MMGRGVAVITFPGSNGDLDALYAFREAVGVPAELVDYRATDFDNFDAVVLPGGFAYGDYLRCGAIARFAPVMDPLRAFVERGGPVLGICNGFQVLLEAHLLPGALLMNRSLQFHSDWVHLRVESGETPWTGNLSEGEVLTFPAAHGGGKYFADPALLDQIEGNGQVIFRYSEPGGALSDDANFNGSINAIAGICNLRRNVVGLMPHPERASDLLLGPTDGLRMLTGIETFLSMAT
jgi:phosphoribosylformylglycinamidine synthase subunit PurQ / glutaminase